ncbi:hypothetical protein ACSBR2_025198 [Camellia fascicularis]
MKEGKQGRWRPVLRQRWGGKYRRPAVESGLVTLFVDDIPDNMDPKSLCDLFKKFGVVKAVFIPLKRRKAIDARSGFVRYDCPVAADVAVQKGNGLWWDDKRIKVKKADFNKVEQRDSLKKEEVKGVRNRDQGRLTANMALRKGNDNFPRQDREAMRGLRSYAEVLSRGKEQGNDGITVFVKDEGNGWLFESVFVNLKSFFSFQAFKEEVQRRGYMDILVWEGGGRLAILTFLSVQAWKEGVASLKEWIFDWCGSLSEASKSEFNVNTFKSIGRIRGEVIQIDEDTSMMRSFQFGRVRILTKSMGNINRVIYLSCKGRLFPVRVYEVMEASHSEFCNTSRCEVDQNSYHGGRKESDSPDNVKSGGGGVKKDDEVDDVE